MQTAYDRGWRNVKLYFMIGLPGETDADVLGIAETVEWLIKKAVWNKARKRDRLTRTLTLSNFTPSPTRRSSGTQSARKSSSVAGACSRRR